MAKLRTTKDDLEVLVFSNINAAQVSPIVIEDQIPTDVPGAMYLVW